MLNWGRINGSYVAGDWTINAAGASWLLSREGHGNLTTFGTLKAAKAEAERIEAGDAAYRARKAAEAAKAAEVAASDTCPEGVDWLTWHNTRYGETVTLADISAANAGGTAIDNAKAAIKAAEVQRGYLPGELVDHLAAEYGDQLAAIDDATAELLENVDETIKFRDLGEFVADELADIDADEPLTLEGARQFLEALARRAGDDRALAAIKNRRHYTTFTLPAAWAPAIVNGDESGLDSDDAESLEAFYASEGETWAFADVGEEYFGRPDYGMRGLRGTVADYKFYQL